MTTQKTIAFTLWTFVGKVMSLLFNMLSSDFTFTFHFHALEKEMAPHSSVLAWRIPRTEEPGGLQFMGLQRAGYNWQLTLSLRGFIFSYRISPFNEYSGLISFRIGWFDLLAVQGTLKSLI